MEQKLTKELTFLDPLLYKKEFTMKKRITVNSNLKGSLFCSL